MNKNRMKLMLVFVFLISITLSNVFAVNIFDSKTTEEIYKLSEDESNFNIPFFRGSNNRMELDRSISQSGVFYSNSSIDVNEKLEGIQAFFSGDTIRINNDIDYAVIWSRGNVIINSTINESLVVFCDGTITLGENANVKGNIICCSSKLDVLGKVDGNILGISSVVNINNEVKGTVRMTVDQMNFNEYAKVDQGININTTNPNLKIDESVAMSKVDLVNSSKISIKTYAINVLYAVLSDICVFVLIIILIKKEKINKAMQNISNNNIITGGISAFISLIAIICIGIVALLALPKIGIAGIIFSASIMIIITLIKNIVFGLFVVKLVEKKYNNLDTKPNNILTAIVVFLLLEILEILPIIGEIISFVVFILVLGLLLSAIKKDTQDTKIVEVQPKQE